MTFSVVVVVVVVVAIAVAWVAEAMGIHNGRSNEREEVEKRFEKRTC
jgi:hypothetical protein